MKLEKKGKLIQIQREELDSNEKFFGVRIENKISVKEWEILKKCVFQKIKLTLEAEEPILDEAERKYLSNVIRPFRDEVEYIIKKKSYNFENKEYLVIHSSQNQTMPFPYFKKGIMYKNLELDKEYTLDDLNL